MCSRRQFYLNKQRPPIYLNFRYDISNIITKEMVYQIVVYQLRALFKKRQLIKIAFSKYDSRGREENIDADDSFMIFFVLGMMKRYWPHNEHNSIRAYNEFWRRICNDTGEVYCKCWNCAHILKY